MGINAGKLIIKSENPDPVVEPIRVQGSVSSKINAGNVNVLTQPELKQQEPVEIIPAPIKIMKKKDTILHKRNRTGIFNFEKTSSYMDDMLAI